MISKVQLYFLKQWFFSCCIFFVITPVQVISAPGTTVGVCKSGLSGISTINVYANSHASEESSTSGGFTLTRTNDLSKQVSVSFILSGTAQHSIDYKSVAAIVQFDVGESEKIISIMPIDDTTIEGNEEITLTLAVGANYILGNHISDTINLNDNDFQSTDNVTTQPQDSSDGDRLLNNNYVVRKLTITSATQVDLNIGKLIAGSAFEIISETCSNTILKAGTDCQIEAMFNPANSEQQPGILKIPTPKLSTQSIVELNDQGEVISVSGERINVISTPLMINLSGNATTCRIDSWKMLDPAKSSVIPEPPGGAEFIPGFDIVEFKASSCEPGATLNIIFDYQQVIPAEAKLMQFSATPEDVSDHWHEIKTAEITGNQARYSVTDGQEADQDLSGNGSIQGLVGLLIPRSAQVAAPGLTRLPSNSSQTRSIPTVHPIALVLMVISLAGLARRSFDSGKNRYS